MVAEFGRSNLLGSLMQLLLWDQISCRPVVAVYIHVEGEVEGTRLGHGLVMLRACRWRSR